MFGIPLSQVPAELLRHADAVMRQAQPGQSASFRREGVAYRVRWVYPGRLVVSLRNEGIVIVQSRLGHPTKPERPRRPMPRPPGLPIYYPWPWGGGGNGL